MALFGNTQKKKTEKKSARAGGVRAVPQKDFSWVIVRPRITEKATLLFEKGVYAFEVSPRATARDVSFAIQALYKVVPKKVNMLKTPATTKRSRRGGTMRVPGVFKAYVFLQKGDTITLA